PIFHARSTYPFVSILAVPVSTTRRYCALALSVVVPLEAMRSPSDPLPKNLVKFPVPSDMTLPTSAAGQVRNGRSAAGTSATDFVPEVKFTSAPALLDANTPSEARRMPELWL